MFKNPKIPHRLTKSSAAGVPKSSLFNRQERLKINTPELCYVFTVPITEQTGAANVLLKLLNDHPLVFSNQLP